MPIQTSQSTPHQTPLQSITRRDSLKIIAATTGYLSLTSPALATLLHSPAKSDPLLPWTELKPNFHAFVDLNTGGNVLLRTTKDAIVMVDTKYPHLAGAIKADAEAFTRADSKNGSPKLILINTHHHGDHTAGNPLIIPHADESYTHKNAIPRIQSLLDTTKESGKNAVDRIKGFSDSKALKALAQQAADASDSWTNTEVTPTTAVDAKATDIQGTDITLHHFGPGHTDNDLVVEFKDDNVIHTGDLVFSGLHPYFDPTAGVSAMGWLVAVGVLYQLCDKDTIVVPGHGEPGDRAIIQNQIDYLTQILIEVQKQIDAGTSKEDTASMEWDFMKGLGFESIRERAINAVYDELAS
tara:strand:+ start:269547 stop:270608 length:1062 start_codon:yes stop_codon:yes gene_type:complete